MQCDLVTGLELRFNAFCVSKLQYFKCTLPWLHCRDSIESAKQKGKGMAQDLLLISGDWGFELSDVQDVYQGSIHIFNGDQDLLVPLGLQQCIKKVVSVYS